jgi:D-alanyl-D-alanine carboxypeptidase (penicillin-binding protein 5/6)
MRKGLLVICSFLLFSFLFLLPVSAEEGSDSVETELIPGAVSGVLMEANSGKIVFAKEENKEVAVASMTKMVAQILILDAIREEKISWDDVVTVSQTAADMGGSQIYLSVGEKISIRDLFKGISMASANDATVQMAEVLAGSEAAFVEEMNQKVKDLGLKHTVFKNCTGLDEDGHYSSAYDMAMIARELVVNYPEIFEFSSVYEDYLRKDTENEFWLVNTNKLVRFYEGADGLKTGHTDAAKYCLAATAKKDNLRFIAIVLGEENSNTRNQEVMSLLDYGFNHYQMNLIKSKDEVLQTIPLDKANKESMSLVAISDIGVLSEKTATKRKYDYDIKLKKYSLPVKSGDIVGEVIVKENNKEVTSVPVTVSESVSRLSFLELFGRGFIDLVSGDFTFSFD